MRRAVVALTVIVAALLCGCGGAGGGAASGGRIHRRSGCTVSNPETIMARPITSPLLFRNSVAWSIIFWTR